MPEKIKDVKPPSGSSRLLFRMPIWFYKMGLGGMLGGRFLLLTHRGRISGQPRQTVLEVVNHDELKNVFVVAAGFGTNSDWYRNVKACADVTIQCGRKKWPMTAVFLAPEESGTLLMAYYKRYPFALKELAQFMGYRLNGTDEDVRAMGKLLSMVAFHPKEQA
jgi:deazaflavin-dependent oxidoreductase (nitroreductase family)